MMKISDFLSYLNEIAPINYALGFDNVGLLVGDKERDVNGVIIALDITESVIDEAIENGANLIVSHHPVIFEPLKSVVAGDTTANHVIALIENKISAICMHTNLDAAAGGVNDTLADKIGITKEGYLEPIDDVGIGRFGDLNEEMNFNDFLTHTAKTLMVDGLRYCEVNNRVKRVAVGGGSCGNMLQAAIDAGCDTFITADVKHNIWRDAQEKKINLIDAGHFSTENVIVSELYNKLVEKFPNIKIGIAKAISEPMKHFKPED